MFFRRQERKRHPWLTLALCGMSAAGTLYVVKRGRALISEKLRSVCRAARRRCRAMDD